MEKENILRGQEKKLRNRTRWYSFKCIFISDYGLRNWVIGTTIVVVLCCLFFGLYSYDKWRINKAGEHIRSLNPTPTDCS